MKDNKIKQLDGLNVLIIYGIISSNINRTFRIFEHFNFGSYLIYVWFMISGFIFAYLNWDSHDTYSVDYSIGLYKRKLKIVFPIHVATFLLAGVWEWRHMTIYQILTYDTIVKTAANFFLAHSIMASKYYSVYNGASWYLSALLVIYFFAPMIIFALKKVKAMERLYCTVAGIFLFFFVLILLSGKSSNSFWILYTSPISYCVFFIFGIVIGRYVYLNHDKSKQDKTVLKKLLIILISLMIIGTKLLELQRNPYSYLIKVLILGAIAVYIVGQGNKYISKILGHKIFCAINAFAFEVYMFHLIVFEYISSLRLIYNFKNLYYFIIIFAMSIIAGYLWHYYDQMHKARKAMYQEI